MCHALLCTNKYVYTFGGNESARPCAGTKCLLCHCVHDPTTYMGGVGGASGYTNKVCVACSEKGGGVRGNTAGSGSWKTVEGMGSGSSKRGVGRPGSRPMRSKERVVGYSVSIFPVGGNMRTSFPTIPEATSKWGRTGSGKYSVGERSESIVGPGVLGRYSLFFSS